MTSTKKLLGPQRQAQLDRVRTALERVGDVLTDPSDLETVRTSIEDLDDPFLLVVVGEFNAGKSALINALLGERVLDEGVTPTTSVVRVLRHADDPGRPVERTVDVVPATAPILRDVHLVDTPGTNAITREHEALTDRFVPRADLILFTTSADRPFTESEHRFMERIRQWGKKIVIVVNKIDILSAPTDLNSVTAFIETNVHELLGFTPQVFPVSAKVALEARANTAETDPGDRSGLDALKQYILTTLDDAERFRLKLLNPVGVGRRLVHAARVAVQEQRQVLSEDLTTVDAIRSQLNGYTEQLTTGLSLRMAGIDNVLHQLEQRGQEFFEETVRLGRLAGLLNRSKLRADFEREVIRDLPKEIEQRVGAMIDWLITSDLQQWHAVRELLVRRKTADADTVAGQLGRDYEVDRARLLDTIGKTAQGTLDRHDRRAESARVADSVQSAVANAALLEVGAVGLGTIISMVATSTAVDVTGTLAAGLLATLGVFVIPRRRRQAKRELHERISILRTQLTQGVTTQFEREVSSSAARIEGLVAPYLQFVEDEQRRLDEHAVALTELDAQLDEIQQDLGGSRPATLSLSEGPSG